MAGLRKMRKTIPANEEAQTCRKDGGLRVPTRQGRPYDMQGTPTRPQTRSYRLYGRYQTTHLLHLLPLRKSSRQISHEIFSLLADSDHTFVVTLASVCNA